MKTAPIALFAYNRPWHTEQTISALKRNLLAEVSDLYVFSDGPKDKFDEEQVRQVRAYLKTIDGFRNVRVIERPANSGLARSIIDGVTEICDAHGRIIVLEDDMVTSEYFLQFMNDGLDKYENVEDVISIHGYMYPVRKELPETFFLRGADCWGWATWKRGWHLFEPNGLKLLREIRERQLAKQFNYDGTYDYIGMLEAQNEGRNNSWAIRWYASAFLRDKLTLYTGRSLVDNIGNDSSGTHCGTTNQLSGLIGTSRVHVGDVPIVESDVARLALVEFFAEIGSTKTGLVRRAIRALSQFSFLGRLQ